MAALNRQTREIIKHPPYWLPPVEGLTIAGYIRHSFPEGTWHGDACGCPDDRCIGYHHDAGDECGCLLAMLAECAAATASTR